MEILTAIFRQHLRKTTAFVISASLILILNLICTLAFSNKSDIHSINLFIFVLTTLFTASILLYIRFFGDEQIIPLVIFPFLGISSTIIFSTFVSELSFSVNQIQQLNFITLVLLLTFFIFGLIISEGFTLLVFLICKLKKYTD